MGLEGAPDVEVTEEHVTFGHCILQRLVQFQLPLDNDRLGADIVHLSEEGLGDPCKRCSLLSLNHSESDKLRLASVADAEPEDDRPIKAILRQTLVNEYDVGVAKVELLHLGT